MVTRDAATSDACAGEHAHVPAVRVLAALGLTVCAAAIELVASARGGSFFLLADAVHLLAHVGIFGILLVRAEWWHDRGEDVATVLVLLLILSIAAGVVTVSVRALMLPVAEPPAPAVLALSLLGLAANVGTAWLFADPARRWWSFRAALAHELSDGMLTVVGLVGALAIWLFAWRWVDPGLSLAVGLWLGGWAARLVGRRIRLGVRAWER